MASEYDSRAPVPADEGSEKINNERAKLRTAVPVIGPDGILQSRSRFENCENCVFFRKPNTCAIVEGPVDEEQVCDWIQSRGAGDKEDHERRQYTVDDVRAFVWGMMKEQPYSHRVLDVQLTPEGWLMLIEDSATPPHRFSLSLGFTIEHTSQEHHWTQEEVDALIRTGKAMDFKPPINFEEASDLFGRGLIDNEMFEPFKRARAAERRRAG